MQGVTTLGTIYSSSLFPGRCPNGEMLLLNYIGGATNRSVKDVSCKASGFAARQLLLDTLCCVLRVHCAGSYMRVNRPACASQQSCPHHEQPRHGCWNTTCCAAADPAGQPGGARGSG
eukprot:GHRQ01023805.1.p1 GENE.GHRQ01023805.1~~GHRQ01023805.1.p1  ORF type:complete len:118 (-),score=34.07 GHRQ01023805.1:590-943(-)